MENVGRKLFPSSWDCTCFPSFNKVPVIADKGRALYVLNKSIPPVELAPGAAETMPIPSRELSATGVRIPQQLNMCSCLPAKFGINEPFLVYLNDQAYIQELTALKTAAHSILKTPDSAPRPIRKKVSFDNDVRKKSFEKKNDLFEEEEETETGVGSRSTCEDLSIPSEDEGSVLDLDSVNTEGSEGLFNSIFSLLEGSPKPERVDSEEDLSDGANAMGDIQTILAEGECFNPNRSRRMDTKPLVEKKESKTIKEDKDILKIDESLINEQQMEEKAPIVEENKKEAPSLGSAFRFAMDAIDGNMDNLMDYEDGLHIDESAGAAPRPVTQLNDLQIDAGEAPPPIDLNDSVAFMSAFKSGGAKFDAYLDFLNKHEGEKSKKKKVAPVQFSEEAFAELMQEMGMAEKPKAPVVRSEELEALLNPADDETTVREPSPSPDPIECVELSDDEPVRPSAGNSKKRRRIRRRYDDDEDDEIEERTYSDYKSLGFALRLEDFVEESKDEALNARIAEKRRARAAAKEIAKQFSNVDAAKENLKMFKSVKETKDGLFAQAKKLMAEKSDLKVSKKSLQMLNSTATQNPFQYMLLMSRHPFTASGGLPASPFFMTSYHQVQLLAKGHPHTGLRTLCEVPYCGYFFRSRYNEGQGMADYLDKISKQPSKRKAPIDNEQFVFRLVKQKMEENRLKMKEKPAANAVIPYYQAYNEVQQPSTSAASFVTAPLPQPVMISNPLGQDQEMINLAEALTDANDLFDDI